MLNKTYSYVVGIILLISMVFTTYWSYAMTDYPPPTETFIQNLEAFLLVYLLDLILVLGTTLTTYRMVRPERKEMFRSSWWLLAMIFITFIISYFGSSGVTIIIPNAPVISFLQFPWDTIIMIVVFFIVYLFGLRAGYRTEDLRPSLRNRSLQKNFRNKNSPLEIPNEKLLLRFSGLMCTAAKTSQL